MKVGIYTAIYGGYDPPRPLPPDLSVDRAVLYTDSDRVAAQAEPLGWEPRVVRHGIATCKGSPAVTAPMLAHKWWKLHPHLALPDCDVSMWIDGSMLLDSSAYPHQCLVALGDDDWSMVEHPWRNCAIEEGYYSAGLVWRYDKPSLTAQTDFYASFHPAHWGLYATGANIRRHTPAVAAFGQAWWQECLNWSHQDQVSLPVLLRLMGRGELGPMFRWNANLPWAAWWRLYEHGQPT